MGHWKLGGADHRNNNSCRLSCLGYYLQFKAPVTAPYELQVKECCKCSVIVIVDAVKRLTSKHQHSAANRFNKSITKFRRSGLPLEHTMRRGGDVRPSAWDRKDGAARALAAAISFTSFGSPETEREEKRAEAAGAQFPTMSAQRECHPSKSCIAAPAALPCARFAITTFRALFMKAFSSAEWPNGSWRARRRLSHLSREPFCCNVTREKSEQRNKRHNL